MAGKMDRHRERRRQNTPLLFLMLVLTPLFGGYYTFSALLSGGVLVAFILWQVHTTGQLSCPVGPEAFALCGLCLANLIVIPFSVSWGMALAGFLRVAVWALFFLYAASYTAGERADILDALAWEGAILSGLMTVVFLVDAMGGVEDVNGRIDGLFQYANTWALYQLVCLILLALREKRKRADWAAMAILLVGIYLSGSRGIFLLLAGLAVAYALWYGLRQRTVLKPLLAAAGGVALLGVAAVFSGGMVWERLQAITLSSSSLNGRLLYVLDGLNIFWEHPVGLGRGGYLYVQPLYQTGVYTLRYIHNEYLQAALDGGLLAGVCLVVLVLALLFRRGAPMRERAVVFAVAAHAFIDFDFQFTAVVFLMLLCGSGGKCRTVHVPRRAGTAAGCVLVLLFGYGSLAYFLDFWGYPQAAWRMVPGDLSLAENCLQSYGSVEQAEPMANRILEQTDLSMVAWDCKFAACTRRDDGPGMARAKYQYLRLNGYRGEVYQEFVQLLEHLSARGSQEELQIYAELAQKALVQLEEVSEKTSPLAYRIVDKPELEFIPEITARLQTIIQMGA